MHDLDQLVYEVKQDMKKWNVPYTNIPIVLNSRLSKSLGRCKFKDEKAYEIDIQKQYFLTGKKEDIKNTICHELIHSAPGCAACKHKGIWAQYANIMNAHGYNIQEFSQPEFEHKKTMSDFFYFEIYCPKCHCSTFRKRSSKMVQHPELWLCAKCHVPLKSRRVIHLPSKSNP